METKIQFKEICEGTKYVRFTKRAKIAMCNFFNAFAGFKVLTLIFLLGGLLGSKANAQFTITGSTGQDGNYTSLTGAGGVFAALRLIDLTGRVVLQQSGLSDSAIILNTSQLPTGIYQVELNRAGTLNHSKLIIH